MYCLLLVRTRLEVCSHFGILNALFGIPLVWFLG